MDQNERRIIDDLFARLGEAERRAAPRDGEALRLIQDHLGRQPAAPYYMAQAIVVQQEALANAQARLEQLERELSERPAGGGFLGGLFGGGESAAPRPPTSAERDPRRPVAGQGPWSRQGHGGGFLAGAAQTAMGVAGGMLVANALVGMLAPDPAQAAEPGMDEDLSGAEPGADDGWSDGGDMGFDDF